MRYVPDGEYFHWVVHSFVMVETGELGSCDWNASRRQPRGLASRGRWLQARRSLSWIIRRVLFVSRFLLSRNDLYKSLNLGVVLVLN